MDNRPILYSFRRCPYAIRARLAIYSAGVQVELREILLREKAPKFLETSESKTVPCLQTKDTILDESLEIMIWALNINCLLYTSPSPRDLSTSRMPSSA